jgi:hypothetical protein
MYSAEVDLVPEVRRKLQSLGVKRELVASFSIENQPHPYKKKLLSFLPQQIV